MLYPSAVQGSLQIPKPIETRAGYPERRVTST